VARDHLVEEYQRGLRGELTPDCSFDACTVCGLCTGENKLAPVHQRATLDDVSDTLPARETAPESEGEERKWRFKYRRVGAGVFVSTLEMQGMIFRAFRRAGIPMVYDEGMRPRPKLAMGQALPLGVTSQGEYFDMSLTTTRAISDVVARLNRYFPADLAILDAGILASSSLSIRQMCREHVYRAILSDLACEGLERETVEARVAEFPKMRECKLARSHKTGSSQIKTSEIDLRKEVLSMRVRELAEGVVLEFSMNAEAGQSASPYAVIEWLLGDATAARRIQLHKI
jgi:radical SAM-linked protein